MTVGLLGGTFDPIHTGHLDVARAARKALGIDEVWFVPARQPSHRAQPAASAAHRFAMVALALADEDGLLVSDLEMDTGAPSYTIDTLQRAEARFPHVRRPFFVITGADAFRDIRTWRSWEQLAGRCHFVVVSRPGMPAGDMRRAVPELAARMIDAPCAAPPTPSIFLVDAPTADVSSTGVRRALKVGGDLAGLIPGSVATYAVRHALYRREPSMATETTHE